jgi:hypothetical protein
MEWESFVKAFIVIPVVEQGFHWLRHNLISFPLLFRFGKKNWSHPFLACFPYFENVHIVLALPYVCLPTIYLRMAVPVCMKFYVYIRTLEPISTGYSINAFNEQYQHYILNSCCNNHSVSKMSEPINLGRCPSLPPDESESMLRTYLICRENIHRLAAFDVV